MFVRKIYPDSSDMNYYKLHNPHYANMKYN